MYKTTMRMLLLWLGMCSWGGVAGRMYDVVDGSKLGPIECRAGCARWSHLAEDGAVLPLMQTN